MLGLPDVRGREALVVAILIDSLGSGLFLPFAVIYPTVVAGIPLGTTGLLLSVATLAALPIPLLAGVAVDHWGARSPVILANLSQAVGFAGYLMITDTWHLLLCALCVALGNQAYWATNGAFLAAVARPVERPRWFALQGACRSAGLGVGTALSGIAAALLSGGRGFQLLAALNSVSFVVAALLCAWVPMASVTREKPTSRKSQMRWRHAVSYGPILRDRPFLGFTATNVAFSLCVLSFSLILPAFVLGPLRRPAWMVGTLFTMNTALIAMTQTVVAGWVGRFRRTRALATAAGLFGLAFAVLAIVACRGAGRAETGDWSVVGLIAAMGIYSLAELIMAPLKNALVADVAPDEWRGRYMAFYHLSWSVASMAAPAMLTCLLARSALVLWAVLAVIAALAALSLLRLDVLLPEYAVLGAAGRDGAQPVTVGEQFTSDGTVER